MRRRMSQLQTGSPYQLSLMGKIKTKGRSADQILERALHEKYASWRLDVSDRRVPMIELDEGGDSEQLSDHAT